MHRFGFHFQYFLKKDINELYVAHALRMFSFATISIFIPIFLLEKGFGFTGIALYYLVYLGLFSFFSYFSLKFAAKHGVKKSMFISSPIVILFFLLMYNINFMRQLLPDTLILIILALVITIGDALYWMGFHVEFAKFSDKSKTAKQYSIVSISTTVSGAIAPLIGAFLITTFGFNIMFIIIIGLLVISIFPLFLSKERHVPFESGIKFTTSQKNSKLVFPFFAEGFHYVALSVVWPIMLYLLFSNYNNVGGIYAVANALLAATTLFLSTRITKLNKAIFLRLGSYFHAISIVIRMFIRSLVGMYFTMGYAGFSNSVLDLPFQSTFYDNAKKLGITSTIFLREIYLSAGRATACLLFLVLLYFLEPFTAMSIIIFIAPLFVLVRGYLPQVGQNLKK